MPELTPFPTMRVQVEVTFDVSKIHLPEGPISTNLIDRRLTVPQGITMIVFLLETINSPSSEVAVFQTSPIQWFQADGTTPAPTPKMFIVQRLGDQNITILDFNSTPPPSPLSHTFNIVVAYGGQTYGSDPTIVNEPPIG
jgi:hypothetical protein